MTRPLRFLSGATSPPFPSQTVAADSELVLILAALLCALFCVLGLVAVARCAWVRRLSNSPPPPPPNKGLKKKTIRSLPHLTFTSDLATKFSDCAICLAEFAPGDHIRVLPQCGHGFHLPCIDTWLGSHSSCPSCRQILVVARCQKCGTGFPATSTDSGDPRSQNEARLEQREENLNMFLA